MKDFRIGDKVILTGSYNKAEGKLVGVDLNIPKKEIDDELKENEDLFVKNMTENIKNTIIDMTQKKVLICFHTRTSVFVLRTSGLYNMERKAIR